MPPDLPSLPGTYAIFLALDEAVELSIGRLGRFVFPAGKYIYTGSAHGPGGLQARLRHHLHPVQRPHWHIDWLRTKAVVSGGVYVVQGEEKESDLPLECVWSRALLEVPQISAPVKGFGASDCHSGCDAHLLYVAQLQDVVRQFRKVGRTALVYWTVP